MSSIKVSLLPKRFRLSILLMAALTAVGGAAAYFSKSNGPEIFASDSHLWQASGAFHQVRPSNEFIRAEGTSEIYWSARFQGTPWDGRLVSPAFLASPVITVLIRGNFSRSGTQLTLERSDGSSRIAMDARGD